MLLQDEMKLASALEFWEDELEIMGFVDLGKYTPEDQQEELGDHALVYSSCSKAIRQCWNFRP